MGWSAGLQTGVSDAIVSGPTKKGAEAPFFICKLTSEVVPDRQRVVARSDDGRAVSAPNGIEISCILVRNPSFVGDIVEAQLR